MPVLQCPWCGEPMPDGADLCDRCTAEILPIAESEEE
jgi:predicted nucleic acid-binding Zn ribbon protein